MPKTEKRKQAASAPLFQQGMAAILIFLILGVLLYGLHASSGGGGAPDVVRAKHFSCPYAEMIRPVDWLGDMSGTTFVFSNSDQTAHAVLHALRDDAWQLAALDANPVALLPSVNTALVAANLTLANLKIANLQTDQPFHDFPALRFSLVADGRQGIGVLFFSRDVRYLYLGVWTPGDDRGERLAIACLDHVSLPNPYDYPLYQRPVTDTGRRIDLVRTLDEAQSRLIEANATIAAGRHDMLSLQRAMAAFETAMKKAAIAQTHGAAFPQSTVLVAGAGNCRNLRESLMNRMKGQVIQCQSLGDQDAARTVAHDLIACCTLDSDIRIKAWAEREYQRLGSPAANK